MTIHHSRCPTSSFPMCPHGARAPRGGRGPRSPRHHRWPDRSLLHPRNSPEPWRPSPGLMARGMGPGDSIALSPNIPEFAIVFHGAASRVAVSTINPTYTAEEVAFQLRDSQSSMLVDRHVRRNSRRGRAGNRRLGIFIIGDAPEGMQPFTALMGEPAGQVDVDLDEQIVVLPYSSGATGFPRASCCLTRTWWRTSSNARTP